MITVFKVNPQTFASDALDTFVRYQVVTNVFRLENGVPVLRYHPFTEDWTPARKREKAAEIASGRYITFCAADGPRVVGEIMLDPVLDEGRMIVSSFHVSGDYRRMGIGRKLFGVACAEARVHRAAALYISACSSEETVLFYTAMGCRLSPRPIPACVEDEPYDLQLEYALSDTDDMN